MRAVIQRCTSGKVTIDGEVFSSINEGLVVLVGFKKDEKEEDFDYIVKKVLNMRIFSDDNDKLNLSAMDKKAEILIVPNFTIYGDAKKGNRPSFINACEVSKAGEVFDRLLQKFKNSYDENNIKSGVFQADMEVNIVNDGPITIILDSDKII